MRVVAFSCVHWMSRELQLSVYEYEEPLDYELFRRLCQTLLAAPPDVVVNLGDFTETYWEQPPTMLEEYAALQTATRVVKLRGNHDPSDGEDCIVLDGVRYEHGHKLVPARPGADASVENYIARLRENTASEQRLVHGHSHVPFEGPPLDVGSVTFSGTYGEIVDGVSRLVAID
ncbi:hypothetical protein LCGC14_1887130 [marine sediment metagenome]|uniref:Calcineurin-like phosphoesterase domain-containing protein n=1 Tax=marine sediment metagenome TaxID=412755 RepID=A0A0F9IYU6_9ZZZZ